MNSTSYSLTIVLLLATLITVPAAFAASYSDSLSSGRAELKSAGPLAFGPEGILFVGDSAAAAVFALDTQDQTPANLTGPVNITAIDTKVAALLGTTPDQILIHDLAINPISRKAYLSVSRGRGPDAVPMIIRVDSTGELQELSLENIKHASVRLPNAPDPAATDRRGQSLRAEAITDLAFVEGRVFVAGLSNEEFASKLRSIPFPFTKADGGSSIEIFHGAHGRFETNAPVRTFVPYEIAGEAHILAAYTCTPLVRLPVADLKPGAKVMGTTIAELGNRNRPLDMVVYQRQGANFILMNNSSRGVMKINADGLEGYQGITEKTDITGVPYQIIDQLQGVQQLDRWDDSNAVVLVRAEAGSLDLRSVAFP